PVAQESADAVRPGRLAARLCRADRWMSENGGDEFDARLTKLRRDISDFVEDNKLDDRVARIMQNMHPIDVQKVMKISFPDDCRSPSGFVVAQIRKAESEAGRPKDYRWDGRSFSEQSRDRGKRD
ncbi:abhd13, partial [Symbiodinium sp. CCMP2592]